MSQREGKEERALEAEEEVRKRTYRQPTANYNIRQSGPDDRGPLSMKGGDTLPASTPQERGLTPRKPYHIPTTTEKIVGGVKKVGRGMGRGLREAYEYEPSPETKRTVKKSFLGARDEVESTGIEFTGGKRYRKGRRYQVRRSGDDLLGLGDIAGYANMFSPSEMFASRRIGGAPTRRQRAPSMVETIGDDPNDPFGLGGWGRSYDGYGGGSGGRTDYNHDFSAYADQFDPFKAFGRRRR